VLVGSLFSVADFSQATDRVSTQHTKTSQTIALLNVNREKLTALESGLLSTAASRLLGTHALAVVASAAGHCGVVFVGGGWVVDEVGVLEVKSMIVRELNVFVAAEESENRLFIYVAALFPR
jgi:hypothetical protein